MSDQTPTHDDAVKDAVLAKIRTEEVRMKPRAYFVLKALAVAVVAGASLVLSAFVLSYIFYSVRVTGHLFLLGFGARGVRTFLVLFPWGPLLLDALLLFLFEWLLRRFKFGYRSPLLYLLIAIISVNVAVGALINVTPLHGWLVQEAMEHRLPLLGPWYEHMQRPPGEGSVYRGTVQSVGPDQFLLHTDDGTFQVLPPPGMSADQFFVPGDGAFVAGDAQDGSIRAYGFHKFAFPPR